MKYLLPLAILALSSCSQGGSSPEKPAGGRVIECALNGTAFAPECSVETVTDSGRTVLVVHHPDGGFRRFERQADGALVAADGADKALVTRAGGVQEVRVAQDRYRLPDDGK